MTPDTVEDPVSKGERWSVAGSFLAASRFLARLRSEGELRSSDRASRGVVVCDPSSSLVVAAQGPFTAATAEPDLETAKRQAFEASERMRLVVASIRDYAIFSLDDQGRVASWNAGAEIAKGYRAEEIIGRSIEVFYTPEDRERGLPAKLLAAAATAGRVENEGWRVRKDGSAFWADVIITALRDAAGELVGFAKVTRDLTERRQHEEERLRLTRAEEAIRVRDEFLSIASHELRTPLTTLKLQLDSLRERIDAMNEAWAKKLERAVRSAEQLERLIESLLDVSRIATGRLALSPEHMDLTEAVKQLLDALHEPAAKAGSTLFYENTGPLIGWWDGIRVEQVVTNLVSNAIKYGAGEPITVSLSREGQDVIMEVSDGGPGLRDEDLHRIFDRFERAASARHYGGMGLGLYVSREIVRAHGGTIAARNRSTGGACFTVRLPAGVPERRSADTEVH